MFMTGCAGNANPYPHGTMELARQHGNELALEVDRLLKSDLDPISGPLKTAFDHARLSLQPPKPIRSWKRSLLMVLTGCVATRQRCGMPRERRIPTIALRGSFSSMAIRERPDFGSPVRRSRKQICPRYSKRHWSSKIMDWGILSRLFRIPSHRSGRMGWWIRNPGII